MQVEKEEVRGQPSCNGGNHPPAPTEPNSGPATELSSNPTAQSYSNAPTVNTTESASPLPGYLSEQEQIPDHFYDSDLASINQKDFLSDNEPPKDIIQERKRLKKEKMLHIFKTIVRLGYQIDKPARYDRVKLKWREVPQGEVKPRPLNLNKKKKEEDKKEKDKKEDYKDSEEGKEVRGEEEGRWEKEKQGEETSRQLKVVQKQQQQSTASKLKKEKQLLQKEQQQLRQIQAYQHSHIPSEYPPYFSTSYVSQSPQISYNLGRDYLELEHLVTSMKRGQVAVFELEHLEVSAKSGIKRRVKVEVYVIWLEEWTTVIDVDCDGKFMKEVAIRGEGHSRVALHDEVAFRYRLTKGEVVVEENKHEEPVRVQQKFLQGSPNVLWRMMHSMKTKEAIRVEIEDEVMEEVEGEKYEKLRQQWQTVKTVESKKQDKWVLEVQVFWFHSLDDVFLDGRLLKKVITKGVSTARPDHSSLIYYALQFHSPSGELLHSDPCFYSDWWQDFSKLDLLNCRKNHLDDESLSEMMVKGIDRMKPAEVSILECKDPNIFAFGSDYEEYLKLTKLETAPDVVRITVRLYNFTEGRNCFNMELQQKVEEARRKKAIALKYLSRGDIPQALNTFQTVISFFSSGKIDQEGYDEKISALMNSCLCQLKLENFKEVVNLSELILESPKHGYDPQKLKVKGPGHAKIEGKLPQEPEDERENAHLNQNGTILDKCRYRKALSLVKMGEGQQAIDCLAEIKARNQDVIILEKEATKAKQNYQKKSVKMFKNMFG